MTAVGAFERRDDDDERVEHVPHTVVRRPPFGTNPVVGMRGTNTQRRILGAALEVFADVGFHDARVELITEAAGCSRPSFYQYFSSKDDVFWALAGQLGRTMVDLAERLPDLTPDEEGVDALRQWLDAFADVCIEFAPVISAFQAAIRNHEPLAAGSSRISERLGAAFIRRAGAGHPELEVGSLATNLVTVLVRVNSYWRDLGAAMGREQFVDGLAQTVHRLLVGPIAGVNMRPLDGPPISGPPHAWPMSPESEADRALRPRGRRTRDTLLAAGTAILPARGYHDTRIDDIVSAAGVSHGSFYRYFDNKDSFFRALAEDAIGELGRLLDAVPRSGDAEELRRWLTRWFATYRDNGGIITTWQEIEFSDPELARFAQDVATAVLDRLVRVVSTRGFGDVVVDGLVLLALIERVPYSVFTLGYADEDAAIDACVFIIRRGLLAL